METELRKALTAAVAGPSLIPADIEPIIRTNLLVKSPFLTMLPRIKASGSVHTIVRRTAHNGASWFEGESTDASFGQSTFDRRNVTVKIMRVGGKVTDFLQSAALSFVDSLEGEIESATEGMRELMEFASLWGVSSELGFSGDAYQFGGLYNFILNDAPSTSVFDVAGKIALSDLDAALDETMNKYQNLVGGRWAFIASPQMISTISGLQTLIKKDITQIEFDGGLRMTAYNNVPIIPTGFVAPASPSASVANLSATQHGTGSVAAGVYRYKVAAITLHGEQVASAAASCTHTGSEAHTDLAWDENGDALLFAIYRTDKDAADTNANYKLLDIVAGKHYTAAGAVDDNIQAYVDDFSKTPKAKVHPQIAYDSTTKAQESIFLAYLDANRGASLAVLPPTLGDPLGGDPTANLVRYVQVPTSEDAYAFRLKSYLTMQVPDAKVCAVLRRCQRNATA